VGGDRLGENFEAVLVAAQTGAGWAGERLWLAYAAPVAGYLRMQGVVEPDDLTSEVLIGVLRAIGAFAGDEPSFRSWLFTIAHRRLLDARRSASRRPPACELLDTVLPVIPGPEAEVLQRDTEERVAALCARLAVDQRDVLLLRLVGGATVEEVAATLGKTSGAVKALQRRGLTALKLIFEREGVPL
jgi:RNA polymerase sigma-70 factor (ECF subfamily)